MAKKEVEKVKEPKTIKQSTVVKFVIGLAVAAALFISGYFYGITVFQSHNSEVTTQAAELVQQLKSEK